MKKFKEFLNESFALKEIDFGTEFTDGRFLEKTMTISTFFVFESIKFKLTYFRNKMLSFGVFSSEDDNYMLNPDKSNAKVKNMIGFYNCLFFVVLEMMHKQKLKEIIFAGANDKLSNVYTNLFKNKSFCDIVKSKGYETFVTLQNGDPMFHMKKRNTHKRQQ